MEAFLFVFVLFAMWPLVSAAKLFECYRAYPVPALIVCILLTIAGAFTWLAALVASLRLYMMYGTIWVNEPVFWFVVLAYAVVGMLRYILFGRYDRDTEYERLVELSNAIAREQRAQASKRDPLVRPRA